MADLPPQLRVGHSDSHQDAPVTFSTSTHEDGAQAAVQVPSIQVMDEEEPLPRKRYSYAAPMSPPDSALVKAPFDAQLKRERFEDPSFLPIHESSSSATNLHPAQNLRPGTTPSRAHSLLNRLNSLRNPFSKHGKYTEIEEDEEGPQQRQRRRHRDLDEEEGDEDHIPFDISGFGGPIPLRSMLSRKKHAKSPSTDIDLDPLTAGSAAESNGLASVPRRAGTIGGGMDRVLDAAQGDMQRTVTTKHKRSPSDVKARQLAQQRAKETGDIVAIFDISDFEGALDASEGLANATDEVKADTKSYYFPPDPDMPNWRPMSMKWPYLVLLIALAIFLGGIQEYLLQLSIKRSHNNDGLIKFYKASDVSVPVYFAWKYMPTIVLVSYGIMWQVTDFEVKRLEPFYLLSKPTGATAEESLNMDYQTFFQYLVPVKAIRYKQWPVLFSSAATLLSTSLLPVLQSAAVNLSPQASQRRAGKPKFVLMDPGWSRALTVFCGIVALLGIFLLFKLERRKSGLLSDPKGIAGIAAMATRSHILNDFRNLDTASRKKIDKQIRERRYILHKSALWQGEYIHNRASAEDVKSEHPHPIMLRLVAGIPYIISLLIFLMLIPVFMFVPKANRVTEKLPWLLIALATIIKLVWSTLEMDIRMIEPFYLLARRRAPPRTLTLDYTGTMPGIICIKSWLNKHYLVTAVGICSILTEILTVCVSSFSVDGSKFVPGATDSKNDPNGEDNSQETFKSFWVSFGLTISILVIMCVVASVVYLRRRHKFLPREPSTIASVLAFIHQSRMLMDFVDTETFNSGKMTLYLEGLGKSYGLGWFNGRDGEDHCGIDEEPLESSYKWGQDWRKGRMTSMNFGTWEVY